MLIRAYSDLHGMLPVVDPCDVLLIAGDVCPIIGDHGVEEQARWVDNEFSSWLAHVSADQIVFTPGNHDFVFEQRTEWPGLPATLLIDQGLALSDNGPTVYASPWVPALPNWAFHADDAALRAAAEAIPEGTDLWLQHGPPYGILDKLWRNSQSVGNKELLRALDEKPPQVMVCGHIHEAAGFETRGDTLIANVSFVDEFYEPQHRHIALEWSGGRLARREELETSTKELWQAPAS